MAFRNGTTPMFEHTIAAEDWYARDLDGVTHERTLFRSVDMTEVHANGATFAECTFRDVKFNAARLQDTAFIRCSFVGCNFFDTHFTDTKVMGTSFSDCEFSLLRVEDGDWSLCDLASADLSRATFRGVRLREADLTRLRGTGCASDSLVLQAHPLRGARGEVLPLPDRHLVFDALHQPLDRFERLASMR